ncbi:MULTISPECIES: hypothetical protein [Ornithinimicrobium]|jgi:hypothetical protein|uniref:Uncharacterized protein n=1 Tax=Ornithinimicrobium kibberense TaxID=282060 RepID=A0ABV5V5J6_9MICO|nr:MULTISPECIES: hypothetical protein [Ornithinimicrobium]OLT23425.1 hypothetical protein BJF81_10950 [Ornithinimicrobium sp. CNJ-824]
MSTVVVLSLVYALVAVTAFVAGLVTDTGLLLLLAAAVLIAGVVHVATRLQGQGPVRVKDEHDRSESIARHGNVPPERPRGM